MKPALHRQASLEAALQQYLSTGQPTLRAQALSDVERLTLNPGWLLAAPQLTGSHPLRGEALVIADAFEAVTNGMQTQEVMQELETLSRDSLFQPWKHLVLAVHFFYERLDEAALAHLGRVPGTSPLAPLKGALTAILSSSAATLSPASTALHDQIHIPDPELTAMAQQLTDTLESEQETQFWSVMADFLEDTATGDELLAKRVALWAWNQLSWQTFDEASLLELTTVLWGKAEAFRLAALGTLSWDAEGASLLWGKFLIHGLREEVLCGETLVEAHQLASEFLAAAHETQAVHETDSLWLDTWEALHRTLTSELRLRRLSLPPLFEVEDQMDPGLAPTLARGQLDLFAS